ncbi:hypothetical protein G7046_g5101 [Stylonectria norvegica]|nr:hypothetical protein G7046_g5101 [Stylonectria norvegica]
MNASPAKPAPDDVMQAAWRSRRQRREARRRQLHDMPLWSPCLRGWTLHRAWASSISSDIHQHVPSITPSEPVLGWTLLGRPQSPPLRPALAGQTSLPQTQGPRQRSPSLHDAALPAPRQRSLSTA